MVNEEPNQAATSGPAGWPFSSKRTPSAVIVSVSATARTTPAAAPHQRARTSFMSGALASPGPDGYALRSHMATRGDVARAQRAWLRRHAARRARPGRASRCALARSVKRSDGMDAKTFHARRRFAETPSGRIAYVEQGRGPAAVFLHGVPLNGFHWRHVIDAVSDLRRCIALDLMSLGYTEIGPDRDVSFTAQASMLAEFCDALELGPIDLVGNDSGGGIAQLFAARHPERLRTLTLTNCDTHDNWAPDARGPGLRALAGGSGRRVRGPVGPDRRGGARVPGAAPRHARADREHAPLLALVRLCPDGRD